mmetsp:Transcript_13393/g.22016  ORF Transcript_13393/g.22016 Transcript_13393/m.22016 type:complete len:396 (-) Transcript_13393:253-1440(-)|eukprot:CAMPEP_0169173256 /NCGR_PEP_ID=MMETSP1015-20121227/63819_1 /TAXON_ID=342587 /ORGANISM="Karlodinium micrum, Strain CCMP2283" /LENGTH=395 /DNA_ID=CAMNT_0009246843 /DNA_START=18 /DNA_END=1205 /DNA_ORIENTATION=-
MFKPKDCSLSNVPSLASLSTQVNSSNNSLQDLRVGNSLTSNTDSSIDARKASVWKTFLRSRFRVALVVVFGCMYLGWSRYITRMSRRTKTWGPQWFARCAAAALTGLGWFAGVRGITDISTKPQLVPDRQVMVCMHPHGLAGIGPLTLLGQEPRRKNGRMEHTFILAANIAFKVPILRELFLLINARAAEEAVIDDVFKSGGSVAVFPGGVHEQLRTDPNQEKVSFPPNIGFIRQAIKHGTPLLPLYNFGENQQFGRFGFSFIPRLHPFQSRFGHVVEVGTADPNPSDARVHEIFLKYCIELRRLFNEYKDTALPPAVAARGLKIEWRGHETDALSSIIQENDMTHSASFGGTLALNSIDSSVSQSGTHEATQSLHISETSHAKHGESVDLRSRM